VRRKIWFIATALGGITASGCELRAQTVQSPITSGLLDELVGEWRMVGQVRGQAVTYDVIARRILNGRFVELHMKDVARPAQYEALVVIGEDTLPRRVVVHWLDSFGAAFSIPHGEGTITGDTVQFEIPYRDGPFRDTFVFRRSERSWAFRLEASDPKGGWKLFAEYEVTSPATRPSRPTTPTLRATPATPVNTTAPAVQTPAATQTAPAFPIRDPNTPGFVAAKELPDGSVPPIDADGNFIIGPTHTPAPEMVVHEGVPRGTVYTFTMRSADSRIFPGIARDSGTFGVPSPTDPATLVVTTSHPAPYTRTVAVYVPAQYVRGTAAPFIVGTDGPDQALFTALDNLIAQKRVPPMIAISIGNGGGDAQGSERSLEYDTMSGRYTEFVETEVLPLVEQKYKVKLTTNPEGRATMGGSSGGAAAFIMAWYHPGLYRRVLAYSITAINQQWPHSAETPHGAWEFHERLIPNSPAKPIRVWLEVGDRDFLNPNVMRDGMHDWVVASENMARVLAAKGYHYLFTFARNAGHVDRSVKQQTLPQALEWLWRGYAPQPQ
jgi:iron(III)-enterobactin esterase